jgi:ribosomal peptide maturation radical SAM protein 1
MIVNPEQDTSYDVVLVDMPYSDIYRPSLSLGLIQSHLEKCGIRTKVVYGKIDFAERIGLWAYSLVSTLNGEFYLSDWTFNRTVFPGGVNGDEYYLRKIASILSPYITRSSGPGSIVTVAKNLRGLQDAADSFVEELSGKILAMRPRIVGCTSMFYQHMSSLALLRKVSEKDPSVTTIMGGANCEGAIGDATHRCFPWIDYVVSGEADGFAADLFKKMLRHGRDIPKEDIPAAVRAPVHRMGPGTAGRGGRGVEFYKGIDSLPIPEYRDYFMALDESRYGKMVSPSLIVESSRGCWWGAKNRCLFCGLNHPKASYRSKSPERFISEVKTLEKTYGVHRFEVADNIMDMKYFNTVLPGLKDETGRRTFFYETKSNLKEWQVKALKDAGCIWIQPGIENLDSRVLKLMNKGVSAWQNINLMKWAREYGLRLSWNFLWGFPEEKDEWYGSMSEWLPLLEHLQAPTALVRVQIHRNSHYFEHAESYGLRLRCVPAMKYVYGLPERDVTDLSYAFLPEGWYDQFNDTPNKMFEGRPGAERVKNIIDRWQFRFYKRVPPALSVEDNGDSIRVLDSRSCRSDIEYELDGLRRQLYLACGDSPLEESLPEAFEKKFGGQYPPREAGDALRELKEKGLLLEIDGRLLALGIPGEPPRLPDKKDFPGGYIDLESQLYKPYF